MMLGIGTGACLCDAYAAGLRASLGNLALLIGMHVVSIPAAIWVARRKTLGLSRNEWAFGMVLSYVVGLFGIIFALRAPVRP
jgi:hypothetical protein